MTHPHLRCRRFGALCLVGVAAMLVVAACSSAKPKAAAPRAFNPLGTSTTSTSVDPNALRTPAGFVLPDTRFVSLTPVTGKAQKSPPIPVTGGAATVEGTVTGPGGAVGGATVRIERWVGSASGAIVVGADGGGHFVASGLLGGHYKVRAWLQPSLTTFTASTGFVADNGRLTTNVALTQYNAYTVQVAANIGLATVGQAFNLEALVTQQGVDGNGVVQANPVPGQSVQLTTDPSVTISGANPGTTGPDGLASWTLTCTVAGNFNAGVTATNGSASSPLPTCQDTTSTTVTAPTVLPLAVGQSFTVPDPGPYPAGTYVASQGSCDVSWQAYVDGAWQPGDSQGRTVTLPGPAENFVAANGSPNCTYTRSS